MDKPPTPISCWFKHATIKHSPGASKRFAPDCHSSINRVRNLKHLLHYEDLLSDTARVFGAAQAFLGCDRSAQAIERAVVFSSFDQLQEQERKKGFREKFHHATAPFFRSGRAGGWTEVLSAAQRERIIVAHRPMMERLGYL